MLSYIISLQLSRTSLKSEDGSGNWHSFQATYDQDHDEWVLVLQGQAALAFEDGTEAALAAGDHLFLPRHVKHRVTRTSSPCVWLAVHGTGLRPAQ